jgi:hypothetical protein
MLHLLALERGLLPTTRETSPVKFKAGSWAILILPLASSSLQTQQKSALSASRTDCSVATSARPAVGAWDVGAYRISGTILPASVGSWFAENDRSKPAMRDGWDD